MLQAQRVLLVLLRPCEVDRMMGDVVIAEQHDLAAGIAPALEVGLHQRAEAELVGQPRTAFS